MNLRGVGLVILLVTLAGCSQGPSRQPVSGKITLAGKPLEFGNIQFFTTAAPPTPAGGAIIDKGSYRLPREHGLEPAKYRVRISSPVPVADAPPAGMSGVPTRERIPEKYSSDHGDVIIEVSSRGPNQFDFAID